MIIIMISKDIYNAYKLLDNNILSNKDNSLNLSTKPSVMLVVGVNGAGKTTSIGKIAANLKASRKESFGCCCGYF